MKGEQRYLDTLRNAFDYLRRNECYATGGFGPDEQMLPGPAFIARLGETHNTFETQCGCWAAFKMAKYLIAFTGDAKYGDWVERLAINGLGASLPMTRDGRVFYYSDYNLHGGTKRNTDFGWSCCTGTAHGRRRLPRPRLLPRRRQPVREPVHARDGAVGVRRRQRGDAVPGDRLPGQRRDPLHARTGASGGLGLRFRAPGWLAGPLRAEVNGRPAELGIDGRNWATLRRTWHNGDVVSLHLPMKLTSALSRLARRRPPRRSPARRSWRSRP